MLTQQKLRGGYYTPNILANYICKRMKSTKPYKILEPSCGDGVFLKSLIDNGFDKNNITAIELDTDEAAKAKTYTDVLNIDFLSWGLKQLKNGVNDYDAVIGNPPYIRYQTLPKEFQKTSEDVFKQLNIKFTKLTNAWVPFILLSVALLKPGGRLAMVIPSEIMHISYASELRKCLLEHCQTLELIYPKQLWFKNTSQGTLILFAQKKTDKDTSCKFIMNTVNDMEFVDQAPVKIHPRTLSASTEKWTHTLLNHDVLALLDKLKKSPHITTFNKLAGVNANMVTGANDFFIVNADTVKKYALEDYVQPSFSKSFHAPGILYNNALHEHNIKSGSNNMFLLFDKPLNQAAQTYIAYGEDQKLHERYKCRVRTPWYIVPYAKPSELSFFKMIHNFPKLIKNDMKIYTTDTAYRIHMLNGHEADKLVYHFINPLTALSAELEGRYYGGGVLELTPSEISKLIIPLTDIKCDLIALDKMVQEHTPDDLMQTQGKMILGRLGLTTHERTLIMDAWRLLKTNRQRK